MIGYQVDNEPGIELFHHRGVFEGFVDRLQEKCGAVDVLNERWGLVYWSHRLARWDELWPPDGNTVPSYDLEWRRYQSALTAAFIAEQAAIVRELARADQFVTTCMALSRRAFDPADLNRALDTVNPYYPMQDALTMPAAPSEAALSRPRWSRLSGASAIYLQADLTRAARGEPFLVTETNAISIGESHSNFPAYDGQWRQAVWAFVARGARMVEYWHWHSIHFGHETYWLGVLGHDGEPGRCYAEVKRIAGELRRAGAAVVDLVPDADVAVLCSRESQWAMEFQPPLAGEDGLEPDRHSYERILARFYEGLFGAGLHADIVYAQQLGTDAGALAARWPVLVVPGLYVADDALLDVLVEYAQAGGHLVLGFRSGYAGEEARARAAVMPDRLRAAVGASYSEYTNLTAPVALRGRGDLAVPEGATATGWADALVRDGAESLVDYEHPHLGRWAAITTHAYGRGRVSYVGTLPDREQLRADPGGAQLGELLLEGHLAQQRLHSLGDRPRRVRPGVALHRWHDEVPGVIRRGLCSVTLRHLGADELVAVAAGAGLAAIEWGADVHVPPGDEAAAEAARSACAGAGVEVASYGSYHRAGDDAPEDFDAVLATAGRLGAPRIRIWAGGTPSAQAGPRRRAAVNEAARRAAERAGESGIEVALEYHGGTLTDDPGSTLALLDAVDSLRTYWQPPQDLPDDAALAELQQVLPRLAALHVFSWWPGTERRPLEARADLWRRAFGLAGSRAEDIDALLEFVPGDDAATVAREARTMDELLAAGARA